MPSCCFVGHRRRDERRAGVDLRRGRELALGVDDLDALDAARERAPHEHVAVGADREAVGAAAVLAARQADADEALGDADLRRVLDLEDRVAAQARDVERVVRLVPRERARLVLRDRAR